MDIFPFKFQLIYPDNFQLLLSFLDMIYAIVVALVRGIRISHFILLMMPSFLYENSYICYESIRRKSWEKLDAIFEFFVPKTLEKKKVCHKFHVKILGIKISISNKIQNRKCASIKIENHFQPEKSWYFVILDPGSMIRKRRDHLVKLSN